MEDRKIDRTPVSGCLFPVFHSLFHAAQHPPRTRRWALILGLVIHLPCLAGATTSFVRASGDDAQDGLSPATARASIRPTARMLQNPGDRLIVGPGTYHGGD